MLAVHFGGFEGTERELSEELSSHRPSHKVISLMHCTDGQGAGSSLCVSRGEEKQVCQGQFSGFSKLQSVFSVDFFLLL